MTDTLEFRVAVICFLGLARSASSCALKYRMPVGRISHPVVGEEPQSLCRGPGLSPEGRSDHHLEPRPPTEPRREGEGGTRSMALKARALTRTSLGDEGADTRQTVFGEPGLGYEAGVPNWWKRGDRTMLTRGRPNLTGTRVRA